MNRDQFIARFQDELVGVLVRAFHEAQPSPGPVRMSDEGIGRAMIEKQRKVRDFLGRVYDHFHPPEPKPDAAPPTPTVKK